MYPLTGRDWTGVPHVLAGLLLAGAALALLFVTIGGNSRARPATEPVAPPSAGQRPQVAVRGEAVGEPFTAASASFQVSAHPDSGWARGVQQHNPGARHRWLLVAVEIENLGRRHFNPGLLSYLLRSGDGGLLAPWRGGVVGPDALGTARGLPVGARAEQRLVYRVPTGLRRPTLVIQPSPSRPLEVRIPLARG